MQKYTQSESRVTQSQRGGVWSVAQSGHWEMIWQWKRQIYSRGDYINNELAGAGVCVRWRHKWHNCCTAERGVGMSATKKINENTLLRGSVCWHWCIFSDIYSYTLTLTNLFGLTHILLFMVEWTRKMLECISNSLSLTEKSFLWTLSIYLSHIRRTSLQMRIYKHTYTQVNVCLLSLQHSE